MTLWTYCHLHNANRSINIISELILAILSILWCFDASKVDCLFQRVEISHDNVMPYLLLVYLTLKKYTIILIAMCVRISRKCDTGAYVSNILDSVIVYLSCTSFHSICAWQHNNIHISTPTATQRSTVLVWPAVFHQHLARDSILYWWFWIFYVWSSEAASKMRKQNLTILVAVTSESWPVKILMTLYHLLLPGVVNFVAIVTATKYN